MFKTRKELIKERDRLITIIRGLRTEEKRLRGIKEGYCNALELTSDRAAKRCLVEMIRSINNELDKILKRLHGAEDKYYQIIDILSVGIDTFEDEYDDGLDYNRIVTVGIYGYKL